MELKQLTDHIYYCPHQPETDRPMLSYIKGEKFALVIDAGNSAAHVDAFYWELEQAGLPKPDFTVLTHWHWDHTFGMHRIHGCSIAHSGTNMRLKQKREKLLRDGEYAAFLRTDDPCLGREYPQGTPITVVLSDLQFERELTLDLGGLTARMFHTVSPHSEDTVLIYLPEERVLFLGNATSEDFYQDGYMDLEKLRALVEVIQRTDCQFCLLSHTEPLAKQDLLDYLYTLL